jgi:hypothetical protein
LKEHITFVVAVVALVAAFVIIFTGDYKGGRVYDCGMAEWHPDIPNAVKEACRKRSLERWQEQQDRAYKEKSTI